MSRIQRTVIHALVVAVAFSVGSAQAQFNVLPGFGLPDAGGSKVEFSAEFKATPDGNLGELSVTATLGSGWHIYSTTQEAGGPTPTSFLLKTPGIEIAGPFKPNHKPDRIESPAFKKKNGDPVTEEYFHDEVTWTVPIRIADGTNVQQLKIDGTVKGQICKDGQGCIPLFSLDPTFSAKFAGTVETVSGIESTTGSATSNSTGAVAAKPPTDSNFIPSIDGIIALTPTQLTTGPYRTDGIHATIEGAITPSNAKPGDTVKLELTVSPDEGWHVYGYKPVPPPTLGSRPTVVGIQTDWPISKPMRTGTPVPSQIEPGESYFVEPVTWTFDISIPKDVDDGSYPLAGIIGLQTCTDASCDPPFAASFSTRINVGGTSSGTGDLTFGKSSYSTVAKLLKAADGKTLPDVSPVDDVVAQNPNADGAGKPFDLSKINVVPVEKPILAVLAFAFVGGFILNFMPCVLPVIGLKVMSFVNQAGQSRRKTILLNVWYSAGMLSVFLVLATLTTVASLGWGQQFNYDGFTIPMLAIIFVMGLSFLGVWEIPIPGFASSGAAADLAQKEGYSGAFFKGVITTILATPCSGPGLATALAYCANKPPAIVYLVFTFVGLGMALPYLVIGAFPKLVRFIPKPGAWMDTFKQILGFVLLATVVYMFTLVSQKNVIPTIAFIFALWAACWWIGRVPISAGFTLKAKSWLYAAGFSAVIGYFAYAPKSENINELAWQPFSLSTLNDLAEAQQTVLVDFTADW
jgi:cytochrome c biogenesis protein CcdA/DsbC/DsbD-like thiol-disulfide interchange protein